MKPFLKWVGGKSQLLKEIRPYYEKEDFDIYIEPFVGAGAVLFDVLDKCNPKVAIINDINMELINTYRVIQNDVENLIDKLTLLEKEYLILDEKERKGYYDNKRDRFNEIVLVTCEMNLEKAALMIFLNKTCFNGLYRVNKSNKFNVPHGKYKNPLICDYNNLREVSKALAGVTILQGSYEQCLQYVNDKSLVYIDPPYRPISASASFTSYSATSFTDNSQIALKGFIDAINDKGSRFILSNSDPKNTNPDDDFFDCLYAQYKIKRISANRSINCKGNGRGKITEVLITNF